VAWTVGACSVHLYKCRRSANFLKLAPLALEVRLWILTLDLFIFFFFFFLAPTALVFLHQLTSGLDQNGNCQHIAVGDSDDLYEDMTSGQNPCEYINPPPTNTTSMYIWKINK
jgi:hypothetical protein